MMGAVLQFPGNHHAPCPVSTDASLELARAIVNGEQDTFWMAVKVLRESGDVADVERAYQIDTGYNLALACADAFPFPEPEPTPVARTMNAMQLALAGSACLGIAALIGVAVIRGVM
jgi:hypothetical protein